MGIKTKIIALIVVGYNTIYSKPTSDVLKHYFKLRDNLICNNAPDLCVDCEARMRITNECIPNYIMAKLLAVNRSR